MVGAFEAQVRQALVVVIDIDVVNLLKTRVVRPASRQDTVLVERAVGSLGDVVFIVPI